MKYIWSGIVAAGIVVCIAAGKAQAALPALIEGTLAGLRTCVSLAAGCMLFMGFTSIASEVGLMEKLANHFGGLIEKLFKGVNRGSRAASAIALNLSANVLGLGNAATPFGLSAMKELSVLSPGNAASAAMCMLLCVNISSVQVVPTSVIALRAQFGSANPADIMLPSLFSTTMTTLSAILLARLCERKK